VFAGLGRIVVHHPWRVIGLWVVAAILVIGFSPKLNATTDESAFLPSHYESIQALDIQQKAFPQAATPAAIIVLERSDGAALSTADSARVTTLGSTLTAAKIPNVTAVQVGPASTNKLIQTIAIQMPEQKGAADRSQTKAVTALRTALQKDIAGTDLKAGITGTAAQQLDAQASGDRANKIIAGATIGLILVLLLIIFRSPIIAFLPVITIGAVSQIATGLIGWANDLFGLKSDSSVSAILIVVLFGVGTDYILFLMFRYRERLRLGEDPKTAMVSAVARVGEAISSAAGAVIVAFMALTLSTLALFRSLGPALAIAVAVTLVAGLTLIPAIVSLLGTRVFWPSKAWRREPKAARYAAIGASLGRHPARYAAASGLLLVVLATFALGFKSNFDLTSGSSSSTAESTVWSQQLLKGLPAGATEPTQVFVQSTSGQGLSADQLASYRSQLASVSGVGSATAATLSSDGRTAEITITLADSPESSAAIAVVKDGLRTAAHADAPAGSRAVVGGVTAVYVDIQSAVRHDYEVVFPVAALVILLILGLMLRSIVAPWYLMLSVGLGFAATLGTTVLIFQTIKGDPGLIFILPVIMYLFVVALGTDYNILMIARLREEAREGLSPREAASQAVRHAGPTIGAAGLILAGTFASLILAGGGELTQMGFAISFGIAVAAFVMALFFTPALTALIGHAVWWPGHGDEQAGHDDETVRPGELADVPAPS
jgi:RND superfamily putative drug exporter